MTFDYTGFEPMTPHGSRWVNRTRRDDYGLRLQVAGPWRREGCRESPDASFAWMKILVFRRDHNLCQSCLNPVTDGEVQHIIPRSVIWPAERPGEDPYYERYSGRPVAIKVARSEYVNIGSCGHNLVLLCHRCHVRTFHMGYRGVPNQGLKNLEAFR